MGTRKMALSQPEVFSPKPVLRGPALLGHPTGRSHCEGRSTSHLSCARSVNLSMIVPVGRTTPSASTKVSYRMSGA
jgi:hypothetical protein